MLNRLLFLQPRYLFTGIFYVLISAVSYAQDSIPVPDTNKLVLVFAGDIMGHDSQINGAYNADSGSYNYEPTFRYIADYISSADIAVGNLEVTLAGPPYKGYPQFSSPDELAIEAREAGFDVLINANNHALDRGEKGFMRTLDMLDSLNIFRAGTYRDSLERDSIHPLVLEKNNIRIAILNYTYGTNGLKINSPRQINRIDTAYIRKEIIRAKQVRADYIIVCMHWGKEYERDENSQQQKLAKYIFELGADAIIGSHPHVVQPVRFLSDDIDSMLVNTVFYSLGNFVSNQRAQYKDGGVVAEIQLTKINDSVNLDNISYLPYWVWRDDEGDEKSTFYVLPVARYEQDTAAFDLTPNDIYRLKRFARDTRIHLKNIPESDYYNEKQP